MTTHGNADALFETILELFALTVLLDEKELDREHVEFAHACVTTNQYLRPDTIFSRACALAWFDKNIDKIKETLRNDSANEYKRTLLSQIKGCDLQRRVISSIFVIAVCDFHMDPSETDFINLVLSVWEGEMPSEDELNAVA